MPECHARQAGLRRLAWAVNVAGRVISSGTGDQSSATADRRRHSPEMGQLRPPGPQSLQAGGQRIGQAKPARVTLTAAAHRLPTMGTITDWLTGLGTDTTVVVAVVAALIGYRAVRESKRLREDRPGRSLR